MLINITSYVEAGFEKFSIVAESSTLGDQAEFGLPIIAHIQNTGDSRGSSDAWVGFIGSGLSIEGLAILPSEALRGSQLSYRVFDTNEVGLEFARLGEYAGTRGQNRPVTGFEIKIDHQDQSDISLTCWAAFTDGSTAGPISGADVRLTGTGTYLEALRVLITRGA